jgi:hypothetical protein
VPTGVLNASDRQLVFRWAHDDFDGTSYGLGWGFAYELLTGRLRGFPKWDSVEMRMYVLHMQQMSATKGDRFWGQVLAVIADHPKHDWPELPLVEEAPGKCGSVLDILRRQLRMGWNQDDVTVYSGSTGVSHYLQREGIHSKRMEGFVTQLLEMVETLTPQGGVLWTEHPNRPRPVTIPDAKETIVLDTRASAERLVTTFKPVATLQDRSVAAYPLRLPWAPALVETRSVVSLSSDEVQAFQSCMLSHLPEVRDAVVWNKGKETSSKLPFDITGAITSAFAQNNISRLSRDLFVYAQVHSGQKIAALAWFDGAALLQGGNAMQASVDAAMERLGRLQTILEKEQTSVEQLVVVGLQQMQAIMARPYHSASTQTMEELDFQLAVAQGAVSIKLVPEVIFGICMSTQPGEELRRINPNLTSSAISEILAISVTVQLRGMLARHIGRVLRGVVLLQENLQALTQAPPPTMEARADRVLVLGQDAALLARALRDEHHIVQNQGDATFNPMYLAFEFSTGFALRKRQVEIVEEIVGTVRQGGSCVHQMIMGAGKTTMIMPLVALALADGSRLITAIVPAPLLDMSATVLRKCFGTIFPKMLSFMAFSREAGGRLDSAVGLYNRVMKVRAAGGVMMATPEAVKSLVLKYIELQLDRTNLEDAGVTLEEEDDNAAGAVRSEDLLFPPNKVLAKAAGWGCAVFQLKEVRVRGVLETEAVRAPNATAVLCVELDFSLPLPRDLATRDGHDCELLFSIGVKQGRMRPDGKEADGRDIDWGNCEWAGVSAEIRTQQGMCEQNCVKWGDSKIRVYIPELRRMSPEVPPDKGFTEGGFTVFVLAQYKQIGGHQIYHRHMSEPMHCQPRTKKNDDEDNDNDGKDEAGEGTKQETRHVVDAVLGRVLSAFGKEEKGVCIMDEVDLLLHPLYSELNFPLGPKAALEPSPERWLLPIFLFDAFKFAVCGVVSDPKILKKAEAMAVLDELRAALNDGRSKHVIAFEPHLVLLDKVWFAIEVVPILARWTLIWLRKHGLPVDVVTDDEVLAAILQHNIPRPTQKRVGKRGMQLLNLANSWLTALLAHCLAKVNRVSYGLLQAHDLEKLGGSNKVSEVRKIVVVPFKGKDAPSPAAEFAHPDVLIGLTVLAYWHEGLRLSDLRRVVTLLKIDLIEEGGPIERRMSRVMFESWVADGKEMAETEGRPLGELLPLELVQPTDDAQLETVYNLLRRVPGTIFFILVRQVFPQAMRAQSIKIQASGQELGSDILFGSRIGFSGTPSNLVPRDLRPCNFESGSEGKILATLADPEVVQAIQLDTEVSSDAYKLLRMIATATPAMHCLIDVGAMIMGPTNQQAVEYMLKVGLKDMDAAVFLDQQDRRMVVFRGGGPPVPLSTVGLPWNRRFTFYDQVHTTGMDIKQCGTARAAITVGKDTILRDYAQGAWRMRGIGVGQTIKLLVTPAFQARLHKMLHTVTNNLVRDTLALLVVQEQTSQAMQASKLLEQDVRTVFRKQAYASLLNEVGRDVDVAHLQGVRGGFPAVGATPNPQEWTLVLHHELNPIAPIFWGDDGAAVDFDEDGFGRRFSILEDIEKYKNAEGYELALQYPGMSLDRTASRNVHMHWTQESSPLDATVQGFAAIDCAPSLSKGFTGLRLGRDQALLCGNANGSGYLVGQRAACVGKTSDAHMLVGSTPRSPERGLILDSNFDTTISFEFQVEIRPTETQPHFRNIVHFTASDNTPTNRNPAIFFLPDSTRLHVRVGEEQDPNRGCDNREDLPLNEWSIVRVVVSDGMVRVFVNYKAIESWEHRTRTPFSGCTVYLGNPWDEPSSAHVRNLSYRDATAMRESRSVRNESIINFVGVYRDANDRAMDYLENHTKKRGLSIQAGFKAFMHLLRLSGAKEGFYAIQAHRELWCSFGPDTSYARHGLIDRRHDEEGFEPLTVPGTTSTFGRRGGSWENAVYRVVLADASGEQEALFSDRVAMQGGKGGSALHSQVLLWARVQEGSQAAALQIDRARRPSWAGVVQSEGNMQDVGDLTPHPPKALPFLPLAAPPQNPPTTLTLTTKKPTLPNKKRKKKPAVLPSAQIVRIQGRPGKHLHVSTVEVYDQGGENVALISKGATSSASSLCSDGNNDFPIDGQKRTSWPNGNHTKNTADEWWEVDLQQSVKISRIVVYNRADGCHLRLQGAHVVLKCSKRRKVELKKQLVLSASERQTFTNLEVLGSNLLSVLKTRLLIEKVPIAIPETLAVRLSLTRQLNDLIRDWSRIEDQGGERAFSSADIADAEDLLKEMGDEEGGQGEEIECGNDVEQEMECEQEQEQEQEQELELSTQISFGKDIGSARTWDWDSLKKVYQKPPHAVFYSAKDFQIPVKQLRKAGDATTKSLFFPDGILISSNNVRNYGDGVGTGERRLRSVKMVMEWYANETQEVNVVALSLQEAAAIRTALQQAWMSGWPRVSLRILQTNTLVSATPQCPGISESPGGDLERTLQRHHLMLRFFNCESFYDDNELAILENILKEVPKHEREYFFRGVLACRRRRIGTSATVLTLFPKRAGISNSQLEELSYSVAMVAPTRRMHDQDGKPGWCELSRITLFDESGKDITMGISSVTFPLRPVEGARLGKVILERETWPKKKMVVWSGGGQFWGKQIVIMELKDSPLVDRIEVHTTNDESFGIDPVFQISIDGGVTWNDALSTKDASISIVYCAENDRRYPAFNKN